MKSGPGVGDKRPQFNSSEGKAKANHKPSGAVAVPEASGSSVSVGTSTAGAPKKGSSNWDQLKQKLAVSSVSSSSAKLVTSAAPSGAEDGAARPAKKKRRIDLKKAVSIAERKDNAPVSESIEEEIAKSESFVAKSRYVGLDCEMVGIGASGKQSALARCCLIDFDGNVIFDEYVKPPGFVTDFRTKYSGIRKKDISGDHVISLQECQTRVAELLKGKVLVGHALKNDLDALMLKHPRSMIRDTAMYRPYQRPHGRKGGKFKPRALRDLSKQFLKLEIQTGEHDPSEDARCAMLLYRRERRAWEASLAAATAAAHGGSAKPKGSTEEGLSTEGASTAADSDSVAPKKKKPMNKNKKFKERAEAARLKALATAADGDPSIITRHATALHADDDDDDDNDVKQPVEYPDVHIVHHTASASPQRVSEGLVQQDSAQSGTKKKHVGNTKSTVKKRSQMFAS